MTSYEDSEFIEIIKAYEKSEVSDQLFIRTTVSTLQKLSRWGKKKGSLLRGEVHQSVASHWYTRLAVKLTQLAENKRDLTIGEMLALASVKAELVYIFQASGYRQTGHLIYLCSKSAYGTTFEFDRAQLKKLLLMISIDDLDSEFMPVVESLSVAEYFVVSMAWLSERAVLTKRGEENRTRLIENSYRYNDIEIDKTALSMIAKTWMYCSYANSRNKHAIKRPLNKILTNFLRKQSVQARSKKYEVKKRPTVLVVHEYFASNHAMYRCYAPLLRKLSENFELIALAQKGHIDESDTSIFKAIRAENFDATPIEKIVSSINRIRPDIIYYPSVGMRLWVIMLANLRLAPIQIASLGHPATTQSQHMDYIYPGYQEGNIEALYSEKILSTPFYFEIESHPDQAFIDTLSVEKYSYSKNEIHIAVNSKVMKLSYRLIEICQRVVSEVEIPVIFHFFPGEVGIYDDGINAKINTLLPTSKIYPSKTYKHFLTDLSKCDFCISAFPFGNTNSTVDAVTLRMPVIAHFGAENPAQSDKLVMRAAGYPNWMVADSDEAYLAAILRLIREIRLGKTAEKILEVNKSQSVMPSQDLIGESYFSDLVTHVYKHHKTLRNSEEKLIKWENLAIRRNLI